jgi:hypothetical protein
LHRAVRAELGHVKRARRKTFPAPIALVSVDHDNAILSSLLNGSCRTGRHAGGLSAMHAGFGKKGSGDMRKFASPGFNNSPPFYPRFNMARDFACDFTGSTLDTPAYIDIKPKLFCHFCNPLFFLDLSGKRP